MLYLLDTSIMGRFANKSDPSYRVAVLALAELHRLGDTVFVTPQNFIEFRNFATRPKKLNGLGFTVAVAEREAGRFESSFPMLPDTPDIFPAWKHIVQTTATIGKQVHDARLVAVCHVHGITHLLTFNTGHFARFANAAPGIVVVDPASV